MIRKWLKFNTNFIELLKNSSQVKFQYADHKYLVDNGYINHISCSSIPTYSPPHQTPINSLSAGNISKSIVLFHSFPNVNERGDGEYWEDSDSEDSLGAVAETPAKTQLFEIKGPNGSAFLIEVLSEDLDEVRNELIQLKGDFFLFDRSIIEWFTIKCLLTAKPVQKAKDQNRLIRVHALASGSEDVHELDGKGEYLFVNSVDRTMRAKRILEKLGYQISGILYRFQPKQKVVLEDHYNKLCCDFVKAVERLPKVVSVTHNL